jgi:hypothetical protein
VTQLPLIPPPVSTASQGAAQRGESPGAADPCACPRCGVVSPAIEGATLRLDLLMALPVEEYRRVLACWLGCCARRGG